MYLEVCLVNSVDLCGDLEWKADGTRDVDGAVNPFLGRDPPKEREIAASGVQRGSEQISGKTMEDGACKIGAADRQTLGARDRDQRHIRKARIEQLQIGQILTAV